MERFAKIINDWKSLTVFAKHSTLVRLWAESFNSYFLKLVPVNEFIF